MNILTISSIIIKILLIKDIKINLIPFHFNRLDSCTRKYNIKELWERGFIPLSRQDSIICL